MGICQGCHSGCCRSFAVPLTGADLLRLEQKTGQTFWEFGCRWADPQGLIAGNYAPHFYFQDEPQTPFVICLNQTDSLNFPGTGKCHFLQEIPADVQHPLGTGSCGIYQGRPAACRVFPTKFDLNSELPILHAVPEYGRAEQLPQFKLCPRQWQPQDVDPLEAAQELVVARYEMNFFHQLAQIWNQHQGPWDIFPDFLRDVYSRRIKDLTHQRPAVAEPVTEAAGDVEEEDLSGHILKMPSHAAQQKRGAA